MRKFRFTGTTRERLGNKSAGFKKHSLRGSKLEDNMRKRSNAKLRK